MSFTVGLTFRFETKATPYRQALRDVGLQTGNLTPDMPGAGLGGLSGLVLTGGSDIEPRRYSQRDVSSRPPDPERDELELNLLSHALAAGMPVLAICRGMQLLNVAMAGTLHQDIDEGHTLVPPAAHHVAIAPDTRLHSILGPSVETNSRHHQAVDQLGAGLIVTATAPDGIVEAIEKLGDAFVLGVQWHPEDLPDRRLFQAFAAAVLNWKQ